MPIPHLVRQRESPRCGIWKTRGFTPPLLKDWLPWPDYIRLRGNEPLKMPIFWSKDSICRPPCKAFPVLGFNPLESHDIGDVWTRFLANCPGFSGNKAIVLYGKGGFELDLHWSVGIDGMEPAALLRRCESVTLFETAFRIVGPEDGMILTARHAIRENLAVDTMCRDLFDIRLLCDFLASRGILAVACDNAACKNAAQESNLVPLLALTGILQSLDGRDGSVKEAGARLAGLATRKARQTAERLSGLFFHQVRNGPVSKDLLYLTHSRPARQILAGAWANWREYRDMMRSMEEKLDGAEVPLLRRAGLLARAINQSSPGHLRSIRALSRLKYGE